MTVRRGMKKALAMLLPAGVLGISSVLATLPTEHLPAERSSGQTSSIAERLREVRAGISEINVTGKRTSEADEVLLAEWVNFGGGIGWRNGGWGNGGWRNGGWGNGGWHNWGNGGWRNGGPGWHNWHNFWHNW